MEETKEILNLKSKTNLQCKICDKCCKHRGDIRLTPINILEISKFLKISIEEFLEKYTHELKGEEPEIALKAVGKEDRCILNNPENYKCKIQKVKPMQCIVFPLIPIDIKNDIFINTNTCPLAGNKKTSVNKWLNGNNKTYKRNKEIYIKWIKLIEELQPKWNNLTKEKQEKIKQTLFKKYDINKNHKKQIINNIEQVKKIIQPT